MSKLNELINELCPNGVEYKELGEICKVQAGGTPARSKRLYWNDGEIKWLSSSVCKDKKLKTIECEYITEEGLKSSAAKLLCDKTTLIALVGATLGKIAFLEFEATTNQNIASLYPLDLEQLDPTFLYYSCYQFKNHFENIKSKGFSLLTLKDLKSLKIPSPPLLIQKEIVRLLDNFAELTAELIGEQTLRQQQYEYYREKLLGEFEGEVEYKQLWEITNWDKKFQSVDPKKQDKVIKYKVLLSKEISELIREEGTVKLLTTNETNIYTTEELGVNYMSDGEVVAIPWGGNPIVQYYNGKFITSDNRIATSKDKNKYLNKYIYYYMKDNIDVISSFYRGSGIKHPDMSKVLDLTITIPSLEEQQRIVDILDRFDKLANDINEGLPAEIKLRQQQYEYYRDKLLTFKEKE